MELAEDVGTEFVAADSTVGGLIDLDGSFCCDASLARQPLRNERRCDPKLFSKEALTMVFGIGSEIHVQYFSAALCLLQAPLIAREDRLRHAKGYDYKSQAQREARPSTMAG